MKNKLLLILLVVFYSCSRQSKLDESVKNNLAYQSEIMGSYLRGLNKNKIQNSLHDTIISKTNNTINYISTHEMVFELNEFQKNAAENDLGFVGRTIIGFSNDSQIKAIRKHYKNIENAKKIKHCLNEYHDFLVSLNVNTELKELTTKLIQPNEYQYHKDYFQWEEGIVQYKSWTDYIFYLENIKTKIVILESLYIDELSKSFQKAVE